MDQYAQLEMLKDLLTSNPELRKQFGFSSGGRKVETKDGYVKKSDLEKIISESFYGDSTVRGKTQFFKVEVVPNLDEKGNVVEGTVNKIVITI